MKKQLKPVLKVITVVFFLIATLAFSGSMSEQDPIDEFIHVVKVSDRVIILRTGVTYFDAVTAVKTSRGVVVFDAGCSPSVTRKYRERIKREFNHDVSYVIHTHGHWDHVNGNGVFPDATVIGHENMVNEIRDFYSDEDNLPRLLNRLTERSRESLKSTDLAQEQKNQLFCRLAVYSLLSKDIEENSGRRYPKLTFKDRLRLDMDDVTFQLFYFGKAHSMSDVLIYIPEEKLLISGDLFNKGGSGNLSKLNHNEVGKTDVKRWYDTLNHFLQSDYQIETVIDGHGAILNKDDLNGFYAMIKSLWESFNSGRDQSAAHRLKEVYKERGLESMVKESQKMMAPENDRYFYYEAQFNDQAGHLAADGDLKAAIKLLKIYLIKNPDSWATLDSLGQICLMDGNRRDAKRYYQKSLDLNPENSHAKKIMIRMNKREVKGE